MSSIAFLGPTLPAARATALCPGVQVLPPVAQGDVLRALLRGATRIAIVDGYFEHVPAVLHKEILFALERGAVVYGAASIGALRAAELHAFGMHGVGRIFELYRDGVLEDDDEVAVVHGPAEDGYRAISEAMVNIRDRLQAAAAAHVVSATTAETLIELAKAMPYPMRCYRALLELQPALRIPDAERSRLASFLAQPHASLKERDAVAALELLAREPVPKRAASVRVERSVFFERARQQVAREPRGQAAAAEGADAQQRREALLAVLAGEQHAVVPLARPDDDEVDQATADFLAQRAVGDPAAAERYLSARQLSPERLRALIRERLTVERLEQLYRPEIEERLLDWLHLR